jgi:hypothetical protein
MKTVTIQVAVSNTTADWLDRAARGMGADRSKIASAVLEDAAKTGALTFGAAGLPPAERLRRFNEFMARMPNRPGPPVDASRDSIYDYD